MSDEEQAPARLPGPVRARTIALAADALGRMPTGQVPVRLRKAASFAPAKRAKLVGNQITEMLEKDVEFREHLAAQVKALAPDAVADLMAAVDSAYDPPVAGLVDRAAVAYLLRPEGWDTVVAASSEAEQHDATSTPTTEAPAGDVRRWKNAAESARAETARVREDLRAQLESSKGENSKLRRRLGETRAQLKDAQAMLADASETTDRVRREADVAAREADAEMRRLRQRIGELESETSSARRAGRDVRDVESTRLRLLLDSVVEAAHGLRRELALPPSESLPADAVSADSPGAATDAAGVARPLVSDDPVLLRQLLDLPKVHLLIDGYNVSKSAWPSAPLDQQRTRLVGRVAGLVAGNRVETTVVFDGAELDRPPPVQAPRGIRVRFSPGGVIADDVIRALVDAEPVGRPLVVVTSDRELAESVTKKAARVVSATALIRALGV